MKSSIEGLWEPGKWVKNLTWTEDPSDKFNTAKFQAYRELLGTPGILSYMGQHLHFKTGMQIQVTKQVSDDLLLSDFSPGSNFDDVPWPSDSVEMYFEDPKIPTYLVQRHETEKIEKLFAIDILNPATKIVTIMEERDGAICTQNLKAEHWAEALKTGFIAKQMDGPVALSTKENEVMVEATKLALKVFAYIAASKETPTIIHRKEMNFGGKPGVKSRPQRPTSRVRYFSAPSNSSEQKHGTARFLGRRGHFRNYKSDVFVNKKGTWTYIAPVAGPDGEYPKAPTYKVTPKV